jgi:acyl carrier protein
MAANRRFFLSSAASPEPAIAMIPPSTNAIFETVVTTIRATGRLPETQVIAADRLKDLGLGRLWLLAALIELEDVFGIEFPTDVVSRLRTVGDITHYIRAHGTLPYDDTAYAIAA